MCDLYTFSQIRVTCTKSEVYFGLDTRRVIVFNFLDLEYNLTYRNKNITNCHQFILLCYDFNLIILKSFAGVCEQRIHFKDCSGK